MKTIDGLSILRISCYIYISNHIPDYLEVIKVMMHTIPTSVYKQSYQSFVGRFILYETITVIY